jgi:hypothetical protein
VLPVLLLLDSGVSTGPELGSVPRSGVRAPTVGRRRREVVVQHVRLSFMTTDPDRIGDAVRYLEDEARSLVESQPGNLGMSLEVNPELGAAVVESHWVSGDAMRDNEKAVAPVFEKAAGRGGGTASAERYELASFMQAARPRSGSGVRFTRSDLETADIDDAIANYEDTAIPWLVATDGFCRAVMFVNRRTRQAVNETLWLDEDALVGSRSAAAGIRADAVAATSAAIRALEEYRLAFSSARRL